MTRLADGMALLGGIVLSLLIVLTCVSVTGRILNSAVHDWLAHRTPEMSAWILGLGIGPISGDFEIIEAGVAFAIFAFLPLCQMRAGHASVDILTNSLSARTNRLLRMITEIIFAAVLILITVQLFDGMMSKRRFGEETFILQFPVWWGYGASFCASVMSAVVGIYVACTHIHIWATAKDHAL